MTGLLWLSLILCHIKLIHGQEKDPAPWIEQYYNPLNFTTAMSTIVNGTDVEIRSTYLTPDYRIEEKLYTIHNPSFFKERDRPYRLSPHFKQTHRWGRRENAGLLGCYCCTVYRKYILLAGCAVLTTRHILTTATPTDLILRSYGHLDSLEGILGMWYDVNANTFNSSMYASPSRIHIHPMYKYDYEVNVSHPVPVMYDLSVWAATYKFYDKGMPASRTGAIICQRAASSWYEFTSSIPRPNDLSVVVGFQFMKAYKRRPLPWYKYGIRTKAYVWPCPKSDWHWFHCVLGEYWGRFGFDSGGALHVMMEGKSQRLDGFAGMCSFSLKLRSMQITHYFTVVDTYPVLDFLYDAYLGLIKYKWLDSRFEDTKWAAPLPWWGEHVPQRYVFGWEFPQSPLPNWRR